MLRILKIDFAQTDQRTEMLRGKQNHRKNGHNYGVPHHQRHGADGHMDNHSPILWS